MNRAMGNPLDIGRVAFIVLSICTASLLAGCFGSKTYPNTLDKNLHVHTATDSGSWFSRVHAAVDIHRVGRIVPSTMKARSNWLIPRLISESHHSGGIIWCSSLAAPPFLLTGVVPSRMRRC